VHAVEERLGGKGDVVQLPYLRFPESPPLERIRDYEPLTGYLHADSGLRWSYGAMKNRPADWQAALAGKPLEEQVRGAAAAGFDGLWVDGFGFADTPAQLGALTKIIGSQPMTSESGRFSFFDLRPFATELRRDLGPERFRALGRATLHPPRPQ
jgi:phosphoglycerol transferase